MIVFRASRSANDNELKDYQDLWHRALIRPSKLKYKL
jgi:hypothetical protein